MTRTLVFGSFPSCFPPFFCSQFGCSGGEIRSPRCCRFRCMVVASSFVNQLFRCDLLPTSGFDFLFVNLLQWSSRLPIPSPFSSPEAIGPAYLETQRKQIVCVCALYVGRPITRNLEGRSCRRRTQGRFASHFYIQLFLENLYR